MNKVESQHISTLTLEELVKLRTNPETPKDWLPIIKDLIFVKIYSRTPKQILYLVKYEKVK